MENFNGTNFELCNPKMDNLLINKYLWITISRTKPTYMKDEEWVVLERKVRILIRICLDNLVLLNVS
jgi:hypothetical protein